ncbi:hypothetical protein Tsubulata_020400 [Turnera subulata]|uniref:Uncharacterized protein n=1 Tax=Turnera subulata TaxID=218843 RepID=A0A9Q0J7K7_9ROSI|nr:hypothetical protein Tsubulata_020400 [Turnera subulata]
MAAIFDNQDPLIPMVDQAPLDPAILGAAPNQAIPGDEALPEPNQVIPDGGLPSSVVDGVIQNPNPDPAIQIRVQALPDGLQPGPQVPPNAPAAAAVHQTEPILPPSSSVDEKCDLIIQLLKSSKDRVDEKCDLIIQLLKLRKDRADEKLNLLIQLLKLRRKASVESVRMQFNDMSKRRDAIRHVYESGIFIGKGIKGEEWEEMKLLGDRDKALKILAQYDAHPFGGGQ